MPRPNNPPVTFSKNNAEVTARETLYRDFFSLDLYRLRHRLSSRQMNHEVRRETFECGHTAVLLPLDPMRDEIVLVEQIRIAAYDISEASWLPEAVVRMIEEGESVEDVAHCEAIEEVELIIKRTKPMLSFLASPGGTSGRSSVMVGEVDAVTASGIRGLADENKDIRAHVVNREQAHQWIEEGKTDDAVSVIAL